MASSQVPPLRPGQSHIQTCSWHQNFAKLFHTLGRTGCHIRRSHQQSSYEDRRQMTTMIMWALPTESYDTCYIFAGNDVNITTQKSKITKHIKMYKHIYKHVHQIYTFKLLHMSDTSPAVTEWIGGRCRQFDRLQLTRSFDCSLCDKTTRAYASFISNSLGITLAEERRTGNLAWQSM